MSRARRHFERAWFGGYIVRCEGLRTKYLGLGFKFCLDPVPNVSWSATVITANLHDYRSAAFPIGYLECFREFYGSSGVRDKPIAIGKLETVIPKVASNLLFQGRARPERENSEDRHNMSNPPNSFRDLVMGKQRRAPAHRCRDGRGPHLTHAYPLGSTCQRHRVARCSRFPRPFRFEIDPPIAGFAG